MSAEKLTRIEKVLPYFQQQLHACRLCPRDCGIDRTVSKGYCNVSGCKVYTYFLHKGEEPVITGTRGSGTVFFSGCSMHCVYCQNHEFSANDTGTEYSVNELAHLFLQLQEEGAHNINLVTPTHMLAYIIPALHRAFSQGLAIPLVYNTSSFERADLIEKLDGIVDIYLADYKYHSADTARAYSNASAYTDCIRSTLLQMYRQASEAEIDEQGIMLKGMIVRHLVLPSHGNESIKIIRWVKQHIPHVFLSLMSQYQPYHKAQGFATIANRLTADEYAKVTDVAVDLELDGWIQDEPDESMAGVHFKPKAE
jgi:putative pyruvate formate lyase activating enzyme